MENLLTLSKRRMGFHSQQNGTTIPRNRSPCVQKHQCSESRNPKEKKGRETVRFNGDSRNTELVLQTFHCATQLSIYGAVANWCQQFGLTEEEKGRVNLSVDKKILTRVQLLVFPPTKASGNSLRENILSFEALSSRIQF